MREHRNDSCGCGEQQRHKVDKISDQGPELLASDSFPAAALLSGQATHDGGEINPIRSIRGEAARFPSRGSGTVITLGLQRYATEYDRGDLGGLKSSDLGVDSQTIQGQPPLASLFAANWSSRGLSDEGDDSDVCSCARSVLAFKWDVGGKEDVEEHVVEQGEPATSINWLDDTETKKGTARLLVDTEGAGSVDIEVIWQNLRSAAGKVRSDESKDWELPDGEPPQAYKRPASISGAKTSSGATVKSEEIGDLMKQEDVVGAIDGGGVGSVSGTGEMLNAIRGLRDKIVEAEERGRIWKPVDGIHRTAMEVDGETVPARITVGNSAEYPLKEDVESAAECSELGCPAPIVLLALGRDGAAGEDGESVSAKAPWNSLAIAVAGDGGSFWGAGIAGLKADCFNISSGQYPSNRGATQNLGPKPRPRAVNDLNEQIKGLNEKRKSNPSGDYSGGGWRERVCFCG